MTEMVEKVARAIAIANTGSADYDWTAFEAEARAAILAMREPSKDMKLCGLARMTSAVTEAYGPTSEWKDNQTLHAMAIGQRIHSGHEVGAAFSAMIDAALNGLPNIESTGGNARIIATPKT